MNSAILEMADKGLKPKTTESEEMYSKVSDDCGFETWAYFTVTKEEMQEEDGDITDDGITINLIKIEQIIAGCTLLNRCISADELHARSARHIREQIKDNLGYDHK